MLGQNLILPTELAAPKGGLPAIIDGSGRKARDRIEHFLRAARQRQHAKGLRVVSGTPLAPSEFRATCACEESGERRCRTSTSL
jgi:hypothetical protein